MVITVERYHLAYAAVPKAGCTTVKVMLAGVDPDWDTGLGAPNIDNVHGFYQTERFKRGKWKACNARFRFTVVRDPLSRLLAVYTNRVLEMRDLHNSPKLKNGRVDLPMDPDPDFFFQNLPDYMRNISPIRHHALPTEAFIGTQFWRYDRVFRTTELAELAAELSGLCDREVALPHANRSKVRLTLSDLQPATIAALAAYLEPDYRLLRRYFTSPFG